MKVVPEFYQFAQLRPRGGMNVEPGPYSSGVVAFDWTMRRGIICAQERSQHKNRIEAARLLAPAVHLSALWALAQLVASDDERKREHENHDVGRLDCCAWAIACGVVAVVLDRKADE